MKTLNRWNLELGKFAASEKTRYTLNMVSIRKDDTVVTDGRMMLKVTKVENDPTKKVAAALKKFVGDVRDFCVDGKLARQIAGRIPKKTRKLKSVASTSPRAAFMKANQDEAIFVIPGEDGKTLETVTALREKVNYPNVDKVIPEGEPVLAVEYNGEMLGRVLQFMGKFSKPDYGTVKLSFYREMDGDEIGPVKIEAKNRDTDQEALALVMPLHSEKGD